MNPAPAPPLTTPSLTWAQSLEDAAVGLQDADAQLVVVVEPVIVSGVLCLQAYNTMPG